MFAASSANEGSLLSFVTKHTVLLFLGACMRQVRCERIGGKNAPAMAFPHSRYIHQLVGRWMLHNFTSKKHNLALNLS